MNISSFSHIDDLAETKWSRKIIQLKKYEAVSNEQLMKNHCISDITESWSDIGK